MFDPSERDVVVADAEDEDISIISDDAKAQLRALLASLQAQLPAPVVQGAWAQLSPEEHHAFAQL